MSPVIKIIKVHQEIRNFYCHKYTTVFSRRKWTGKKCSALLRVPTNSCCFLFLKFRQMEILLQNFIHLQSKSSSDTHCSDTCSYKYSSINHILFSSIYFHKEHGKISVRIWEFFLHCLFMSVIRSSFLGSHKSVMDHNVSGTDNTDCLQHLHFFFFIAIS